MSLGRTLNFLPRISLWMTFTCFSRLPNCRPIGMDSTYSYSACLHQSFIDYAHGIASAQRNEWAKIQGRFEDIPFIESADRMMRLIGQTIEQSTEDHFTLSVNTMGKKMANRNIRARNVELFFRKDDLSSIYPLHPLSALILPILCTKFSQNDRTLFTFLASGEPDSFSTFHDPSEYSMMRNFRAFKLHKVYDYFVESAGMSISARPQFQRWVEIQSRLSDASHLDPDVLLVLKTIGLLKSRLNNRFSESL